MLLFLYLLNSEVLVYFNLFPMAVTLCGGFGGLPKKIAVSHNLFIIKL